MHGYNITAGRRKSDRSLKKMQRRAIDGTSVKVAESGCDGRWYMQQQQLLHDTPPQPPMVDESCRGVAFVIPGFRFGDRGSAISADVVTYVR